MLYFALFCIFFTLIVVQFGLHLFADLEAQRSRGQRRTSFKDPERQPLLGGGTKTEVVAGVIKQKQNVLKF